jgi:PAS domain-containing protein
MAATPHWGPERTGYNLAITVVGFYGVAFMVAYLSEKLRAVREELELRRLALSRIQTLYANVIASMSSGLATADSRQRVTFLNQAGGDILGIVPARAAGRLLSDIGLALPDEWDEIRHRTRGREGYRAEIEVQRGDMRRVLGTGPRAEGRGRRGGRADRLPGSDRGQEARAPGASTSSSRRSASLRPASRTRSATRSRRSRDPSRSSRTSSPWAPPSAG